LCPRGIYSDEGGCLLDEKQELKKAEKAEESVVAQARELARKMAQRDIEPRLEALGTHRGDELVKVVELLKQLGFLGLQIQDGGGIEALAAVIEEIARVSPGLGLLLASHASAQAPLMLSGGRGFEIAGLLSLAVREEGGSLLSWKEELPRTSVVRKGGALVISGLKKAVVGAGAADHFVVFASGEEGLRWCAVPVKADGVTVSPEKPRLGLLSCPVADVEFSDVSVPEGSIIPCEKGKNGILESIRLSDSLFGSIALGIAREAYKRALAYSTERYQGGQMICDHDAIRMILSEMAQNIEAASALVRASAQSADGREWQNACDLSAAFSSDAAIKITIDAVQVLGGYGYMKDYFVEGLMRDAKNLQAMVEPMARRMAFAGREVARVRG